MMFSFIELGSNLCPSSKTQELLDAGKNGIFLDAQPECLITLRNKFGPKNLYIYGVINTYDGFCEFYWPNNDKVSQHSSVSKNHLEKHNHKILQMVYTNCFTLDFLVKSLKLDKIELLSIDLEGMDCDILLSTDFTNFRPNTIFFEHCHSEAPFQGRGEKFNSTMRYLEKFGYREKWADNNNIELYVV